MSSLVVEDGWDSPIITELEGDNPRPTTAMDAQAASSNKKEALKEEVVWPNAQKGQKIYQDVCPAQLQKWLIGTKDLKLPYKLLETVEQAARGKCVDGQRREEVMAQQSAPEPVSPTRKRLLTKSQRDSLHREQQSKPKLVYATGFGGSRKSGPDSTSINPEPEEDRHDADEGQRSVNLSLKNIKTTSSWLAQDSTSWRVPCKTSATRTYVPQKKEDGLPLLLPAKPGQRSLPPILEALRPQTTNRMPPPAVKISTEGAHNPTSSGKAGNDKIDTFVHLSREHKGQRLQKQKTAKPTVSSSVAPPPREYTVHPLPSLPTKCTSPVLKPRWPDCDSGSTIEANPVQTPRSDAAASASKNYETPGMKEMLKRQLKERLKLRIKHRLEYAQSLLDEIKIEQQEAEESAAQEQKELVERCDGFEKELLAWSERDEEFEMPLQFDKEDLAELRQRRKKLIFDVAAYGTKKKMDMEAAARVNYMHRRFAPEDLLMLVEHLDNVEGRTDPDPLKAEFRQAEWKHLEHAFHEKGEKLELSVGKAIVAYALVPVAYKFVDPNKENPSADGNGGTPIIKLGNGEFTIVGDEDFKKIQALARKQTEPASEAN